MLRKQLRLPLLGIIITLAAVVVLIALRDTLSTQLFGATRTTTPQDAAVAFAVALLATGLSVKELDQLKRPDYVSIAQYVHEMSTRPASYFLAQVEDAEQSADPDQVQLLQPLAVTGRTVTSLSLEMPALRATKVMKKLKTAKERAEFITAHCTGLMIPDLALMSVPDWTQLQVRIDDFLNQPAAYFRNATSK